MNKKFIVYVIVMLLVCTSLFLLLEPKKVIYSDSFYKGESVGIQTSWGCLKTDSSEQEYNTNMQLMNDLIGKTYKRCS